jgi:hypothetical protein
MINYIYINYYTNYYMNLNLPNACVTYYSDFVDQSIAIHLLNTIGQAMSSDTVKKVEYSDGKFSKLNRKTMVFIDKNLKDFIIPKIWGTDVFVECFSTELLVLKEKIEKELGYDFNICLANYYETGKKHIGWHSDNEEKGEIECIASISIGAERLFSLREKENRENIKSVILENRSLLVMDKGCQDFYQHCVPPTSDALEPRLNLTFRKFKYDLYDSI